MPEYLPVNRAVSRDDAAENYFTYGCTASEILSFLLNIHQNSVQPQAAKENS